MSDNIQPVKLYTQERIENITNGSGQKVTDGQEREIVDNNGTPVSVRKTREFSAEGTETIRRLGYVNPRKFANKERGKQLDQKRKLARDEKYGANKLFTQRMIEHRNFTRGISSKKPHTY